jgi:hypothetical protein
MHGYHSPLRLTTFTTWLRKLLLENGVLVKFSKSSQTTLFTRTDNKIYHRQYLIIHYKSPYQERYMLNHQDI